MVRNLFTAVLIVILLAAAWIWWQDSKRSAALQKQEAAYEQKLGFGSIPGKPAPDFTLTNENGQTVSLHQFQGKVVVLQFMDPECTDICPVVSQELVDADKLMGPLKSNVVFVAVNVNQYHAKPSELRAFSKAHGLSNLSNWYFVTGSTSQLQKVWHDYGIYVKPTPTGDVEHGSYYYFIDPSGKERYLAPATNDKATISDWSQAIAFYAERLM